MKPSLAFLMSSATSTPAMALCSCSAVWLSFYTGFDGEVDEDMYDDKHKHCYRLGMSALLTMTVISLIGDVNHHPYWKYSALTLDLQRVLTLAVLVNINLSGNNELALVLASVDLNLVGDDEGVSTFHNTYARERSKKNLLEGTQSIPEFAFKPPQSSEDRKPASEWKNGRLPYHDHSNRSMLPSLHLSNYDQTEDRDSRLKSQSPGWSRLSKAKWFGEQFIQWGIGYDSSFFWQDNWMRNGSIESFFNTHSLSLSKKLLLLSVMGVETLIKSSINFPKLNVDGSVSNMKASYGGIVRDYLAILLCSLISLLFWPLVFGSPSAWGAGLVSLCLGVLLPCYLQSELQMLKASSMVHVIISMHTLTQANIRLLSIGSRVGFKVLFHCLDAIDETFFGLLDVLSNINTSNGLVCRQHLNNGAISLWLNLDVRSCRLDLAAQISTLNNRSLQFKLLMVD
ncbi:hypothetical protein M5K25_002203 [Dendrobium thyrsiflorum]|uniref:Uncharacterized protein n=1 Tax=Dendrobium thyrsiflorum TaxID=117978 RepID=A0ABD0VSD0_DENTH